MRFKAHVIYRPILAAAVLASAAAPLSAFAADTPVASRSGSFTIGGSVGSARADGGGFDSDDTGWKFFMGTTFKDVIGLEAQYMDFGGLEGSTALGPVSNDAEAYTAAISAGVPLSWATPFAKVGYAFQDVEGESANDELDDDEVFYGVGLRFGPWTTNLAMRLEYERFEFGQTDVDLASLGLGFRFGGYDRSPGRWDR